MGGLDNVSYSKKETLTFLARVIDKRARSYKMITLHKLVNFVYLRFGKALKLFRLLRKHGPLSFVEHFMGIFSGLFLRPPVKLLWPEPKTKTSVSDRSSYISVVRWALEEPRVFENFRKIPDYRQILEHVDLEQGKEYLRIASERLNDVVGALDKLSDLSTIGNPHRFTFLKSKKLSPTILRYLKVGTDLNKLFGDLQSQHIVEVGIGFGGQAAVLNRIWGVKNYKFYDLPEVLELARKFLSRSDSSLEALYVDGRSPSGGGVPGIFLSNYAFSELNRSTQDLYLDNVIEQCHSGYITWNDLGERLLDGYSIDEILERLPNPEILPELPQTSSNNVIIVWGRTQSL